MYINHDENEALIMMKEVSKLNFLSSLTLS